MRKYLKQRSIKKIGFMRKIAKEIGMPLWVVYADSAGGVNGKAEHIYYRAVKRHMYSDSAKRCGMYEVWVGREPGKIRSEERRKRKLNK